MPDWAVQQLRVSLFSSAPITLTEAHWKFITGQDEADNRAAIPGGKQYSGKFLDSAFTMAFAGPRCDILANTDDGIIDPTKEPTLPTFGDWSSQSTKFLEHLGPFVHDFAFPMIRIAFGAVLLSPAESKEDAYRTLARLVQSVKIDPVKMRELNYKVNWPKPSAVVRGLELNQITNWSALFFSRAMMQLTGAEMTFGPAGSELHAARLELDHNTNPAYKGPFEAAVRVPILEELVAMARDNTETGEHP